MAEWTTRKIVDGMAAYPAVVIEEQRTRHARLEMSVVGPVLMPRHAVTLAHVAPNREVHARCAQYPKLPAMFCWAGNVMAMRKSSPSQFTGP